MATEDEDFEFEIELARARKAKLQPVSPQGQLQPASPPPEPESALGAAAREVGAAVSPDFSTRGQAGAAVRNFGQSTSLGFADELAGATGALQEAYSRGVPAPALAMLGGPLVATAAAPSMVSATMQGNRERLGEFGDLGLLDALAARYRADRDRSRQDTLMTKVHSPKTALTSSVAGMLAVPMPVGKGATVLRSAVTGAGLGAASAVGGTEADLTRGGFEQALRDTGVGGGIGFGVGAILPPVASRVSRTLLPLAERFANRSAVKAVIPNATLSNPLRDKLRVKSEADIQELGQAVRESGILGVVIPRSAVGAREANEAALAASGAAIGDVLKSADDAVAAGIASGSPTWRRPDMTAVRGAFDAEAAKVAERTGTGAQVLPEVLEKSSALTQPNVSTWRRAWDTKKALGDQAFSREATHLNERVGQMQAGQQAAAREIERQLEAQVGPDEFERLKTAMGQFGLAKRIRDALGTKADRMLTSAPAGLLDLEMAQTLGAKGPLGLATALAANAIRGRGPAAGALYAPRAARAVGSAGRGGASIAAQTLGDNSAVKTQLPDDEAEGVDAFRRNAP